MKIYVSGPMTGLPAFNFPAFHAEANRLRESLMDAIEKVKAGQLDPQAATSIAKLAAQISLSMQVEANIRIEALAGPKPPLGNMPIGDETPLIEGTA